MHEQGTTAGYFGGGVVMYIVGRLVRTWPGLGTRPGARTRVACLTCVRINFRHQGNANTTIADTCVNVYPKFVTDCAVSWSCVPL